MNLLLLDIGNTNLRWTLAAPDGRNEFSLGEVCVVRHGGAAPLDLLAEWETLKAPTRVVVSNVGGHAVATAIGNVTRAYWGLEPEFPCTRASFHSVRVVYQEPERLGVDRWLSLIAAHRLVSEPVLVVDAGTAVTFDLMLADGQHLGGLILPGVEMMRASLLAGTRIASVEFENPVMPWGTDTATAIAAGSLQAISALCSRLYDQLVMASASTPRILLTGGDAQRLLPTMDRSCEWFPNLVLRGLLDVALDDESER